QSPECSLPPEIIEEYGGNPVTVNCTTALAEHKGMYFTVGNETSRIIEKQMSISQSVSLSDWNVTIKCKVKLNEFNECSKDLQVITFKNPEVVHSVQLVNVIGEETQYRLQCDIINVAPVQYVNVSWYKNSEKIQTESFNDTTTKTPVNESSILRVNISREENVVEFRCEAQLDFRPHRPKLPAISKTHRVSAHCCPLTLTPSETVVKFGDPVSINCSTSVTDVEGMGWEAPFGGTGFERPPVVTWRVEKLEEWTPSPFCYVTLVDGSQRTVKTPDSVSVSDMGHGSMVEGREYDLKCDVINVAPVQNLTVTWYRGNETVKTDTFNDSTMTPVNASSTLRISTQRDYNGLTFRCEAELHLGPKGPKFPPNARHSHILLTVVTENISLFGDPVLINCSTSATDVEGMGWEAPFGGTGFERPPVVTWRVDKVEEWTPNPFCYVTLNDGSQCTVSPLITVYKTPDSVSVSDMGRGPMVEGREYDLKCDVINVAPVQNLTVTWYRGNETVLTQMFNDSTMTPVNASSTLRISTQRDYNGLTFRCEAELHLGPKGPKFPPNVTSPPYTAVVLYKPFMESCPDYVTVNESAAFSIDMLSCQPDGNPFPTVQWFYEEKLINPSRSLTRTDSGKYTAVVQNSRGRSNTSVHITVEYSPSFTCKEHYEITVNDKHQSICEPVGLPTPTLTWFKDGKQMVSPQRWKKNDSGKYLLNAHNTHGTNGNESKQVLQGEDVTLSCSADSNPPSNIRWVYTPAVNSNVTTEGHQKIITITRATSTNAGFYICVAENKVGRNTRFVTLMIKGMITDSVKVLFPAIWAFLTLLIIGLTLLVVYFHNRQKKRGQYNFVPECQMSNIAI
uniref:Hemicentin-1 n=1 Tax=Maylandia zebra TaxID=106582 RepID=A0A3P9CT31_9CICH